MVSYEALTGANREAYIKRLLKLFGLEMRDLPEIYSGNEKYYQGDFIATRLHELGLQRPSWLVE
jgi:hypothetical protein